MRFQVWFRCSSCSFIYSYSCCNFSNSSINLCLFSSKVSISFARSVFFCSNSRQFEFFSTRSSANWVLFCFSRTKLACKIRIVSDYPELFSLTAKISSFKASKTDLLSFFFVSAYQPCLLAFLFQLPDWLGLLVKLIDPFRVTKSIDKKWVLLSS